MVTITSRQFSQAMADALFEHALYSRRYQVQVWGGRIAVVFLMAASVVGFVMEFPAAGVCFLSAAMAALVWTAMVFLKCRRDVYRDFPVGKPWNRTYIIDAEKLAVIQGYTAEYLNWNWMIYWKEQEKTLMLVFGGNPRIILLDKHEAGRENLLYLRKLLHQHGIPKKETRPYSRKRELAVTFLLAALVFFAVLGASGVGSSFIAYRPFHTSDETDRLPETDILSEPATEPAAEPEMNLEPEGQQETHPETVQKTWDNTLSQMDTDDYEDYKEIEQKLLERSHYLEHNPYYQEVSRYQEQIQGTLDVSGRIFPLFDTDRRYYTEEEFSECSETVLMIARNEIFARRGRIFSNPDLQNYFLGQVWYEPQTVGEEFSESVFNDYERKNLELIIEVENKKKGN